MHVDFFFSVQINVSFKNVKASANLSLLKTHGSLVDAAPLSLLLSLCLHPCKEEGYIVFHLGSLVGR